MRRFFIAMVTVVLMTSAVFLSGCSLGTPDRETELKDTLSDTYSELNSTFSGNTGKYPLVAEYLTSWAKSNDLTVKENAEHYMVIVNPATKGCGKKESTVLECAVKTGDFDNSMQPLAVSMTALLGPESHGKITLIVTENNDGNMIGAASVDPKYYECDNFINMEYSKDIQLLTSGSHTFTSTMSADLQTASPSYSRTYTITMSTSAYADPFDFDTHYPNPVETIGSLLATEKSSGNLFQLVSFDCKVDNGYTPGSATAVVVIDDNDVESFTKKFDKSNESMKKKFDKLEDHFVYTMTETSTPDRVIASQSSDNIISLMYTLQTGIFLQDEDSGDIISEAYISSISTAGNKLQLTIGSRSLQKSVIDEMNTSFSTTSGLCDIGYSASEQSMTWSANKDKPLAGFFADALSIDDSKPLNTLNSSECDIFASKGPGLNIISYRFNSENREAALLNTLHFMESLVDTTN